jgi:hypothetical protein
MNNRFIDESILIDGSLGNVEPSLVAPCQSKTARRCGPSLKSLRLSCVGSRVPCGSPKSSACVWWPSSRMVSCGLCAPRHSPMIDCSSLFEAHRDRSSRDLPADRFRSGFGCRWSGHPARHDPGHPGPDARCWCSRSAQPSPRHDPRLCRTRSQLPLWMSRRWAPEFIPC